MRKPCPGALGAFGVPAKRWRTRVELFEQIQCARSYFDKAPPDELSIQIAAEQASLSEFHFIRLFKEIVGKPPSEYMGERRLTHACSLLRDSNATIQEVAIDCGYLNASAFARAFRRRFGTSPGQFRREAA